MPPPYPDVFVDEALATPAGALGAWGVERMAGPFATREEAAPGCVEIERLAARPPFSAISRCVTGDRRRAVGPDNIGRHMLVVATAGAFWSTELARDAWPHGDAPDELPYVASVEALTAVYRLGDSGGEITAIAEVGPPGGGKTRRLFVCGVGASRAPSCADIRFAARGPFHDAGSLLYRLDLACDGTLSLAGWEGGRPVKLVHATATLAFP